MNFKEARAYSATISKKGSILGLDSIIHLMEELENVQEQLKIIHIAGTNGKGSVGAFLENTLIHAGYRVGRYTSPAVFEPMEVYRINQENITEEEYAQTFTQVIAACDKMVAKGMEHPTIFEVETALAFLYFYQNKCDYVLLEVGMGGSTDATNLITSPVCSVLTSISMDHMQFLGNTLEEIAKVKAGIIKNNCPVASVTQQKEAMAVVTETAKEKNAKLWISDTGKLKNVVCSLDEICFEYPGIGKIKLQMSGEYQIENASLAILVLDKILGIEKKQILEGISTARWPGRFELICRQPLFIIDGAHNEDAAVKLEKSIRNYFTNKKITYIIGVLADKEHDKILQKMLPHADRVFTVTPDNPRAMNAGELAREALKYHDNATACNSIQEAVHRAFEVTEKDGVIIAFGSLSYLKEVKECVVREA